ncbi:ABC transporter substrate-binding protein [Fictibacillus macauensis ZFHKF-1]|uniref:ABC transporter substrate-binding protein n=1 Tax=Fictibacillus macauensis ZFHKF-1 TaxID=1196324 RepID=I8UFG3_9BACL|nr:cobalamin-binding protein [Fictibacillus macauensis]EIT85635.1 ABC transporter substrate-binding protein [Fictibacillus macauensis ZFHKF-1]
MRLISICPSNTELVDYLGLTEQLVAVDDFSDWPKRVQMLPKLGPDLSINMDMVEELKPDLVIASLSVPGMEKNIAELKRRNIPHVTYNPQTLEDIGNDLLDLGRRTGVEKRAQQLVTQYKQSLKEYAAFAETVTEKKKLYWEWWPKPVFTPGKLNWLTEISQLAGGENVFADVELASIQTTWEDVVSRDPDVLCIAWVGVRQTKVKRSVLEKRPNWHELRAVQNNKVHILEEHLFCRPSPRLLDGLKKLHRLLWNEQPLQSSTKS